MEERFLGRIIKYDPITQILVLKCDFIDPDKQKILENIQQDKNSFSFCFKKPYRKEKTYEQLKKYYKTLSTILIKLEIFPESDVVKSFDESIKQTALSCAEMVIYDKTIPLVPSKANMSIDELSYLIQFLYNTYGELLNEEENNYA